MDLNCQIKGGSVTLVHSKIVPEMLSLSLWLLSWTISFQYIQLVLSSITTNSLHIAQVMHIKTSVITEVCN